MNRFIFKIFYLGDFYTGFQRQPNGRAIENYMEYAFIKSGLIESFKKNNYKSCSRTDANVSAINNIIAVDSSHIPNLLEINNYLPNNGTIIVWDYAQVPLNFNPRDTLFKTYEYYLKDPSDSITRNIQKINSFLGFHNYQNFIKKEGAGEFNPFSNISSIEINFEFRLIKITICGNKFGREQIRRMIGLIIDEKMLGKIPFTNINMKPSIKPVSPSYLTLKEIKYKENINWKTDFYTKQIIFKKSRSKIKKFIHLNNSYESLLNYL